MTDIKKIQTLYKDGYWFCAPGMQKLSLFHYWTITCELLATETSYQSSTRNVSVRIMRYFSVIFGSSCFNGWGLETGLASGVYCDFTLSRAINSEWTDCSRSNTNKIHSFYHNVPAPTQFKKSTPMQSLSEQHKRSTFLPTVNILPVVINFTSVSIGRLMGSCNYYYLIFTMQHIDTKICRQYN